MEIKSIVHQQHPLTLRGNDGQLVCYGCGEPVFGEIYCCFNCGFYQKLCFVCGERVSVKNSFYICEPCWPQSPIFHQSCIDDFPGEIVTTGRPYCLLHFLSESNDPDCDFCLQQHGSSKYCCGDCNFQIGIRCASMLIKYHKDQQLHIDHFSHRHPLTWLKLDDMNCKLCKEKIDGPGYGCAPCHFYIHKSCLDEFPQEIRNDLHPQHPLAFEDYIVFGREKYSCNVCCFDMQGLGYRCDSGDFHLHLECTSRKPNVNYQGHQHLLILVENLSYKSKCKACGFDIQRVFFVRCVECCLDFHVQCDPHHPLPPTVVHKKHEHPLIYVNEALDNYDSHILNCNICGEERNQEEPFYHCVTCTYLAHVRCAITEVQYDAEGELRHFSHEHVLMFLYIMDNEDKFCYGCGEAVRGSTYGCEACQFYLHELCVELPRQIYDHPSHEHYLTLQRSDISYYGHSCDICHKVLSGFTYGCDLCQFKLDLDCALLHPSVNLNISTDNTFHEGQERIAHFSHKHPLDFLEIAGVNCQLCFKNISGQCYGCSECKFYIHSSCGELLQEIEHPFHPRHSLKLLVAEKLGRCSACCFDIKGLEYRCNECDFGLHPECISLRADIEYKGHQHLLTLVKNTFFEWQCEACGLTTMGTFFLRCVECNLNFHVRCGPSTLPSTIMLKESGELLTRMADKNVVQLYCIVCWTAIDQEDSTYYCSERQYYAHKHCASKDAQDVEAHMDEREKVKHFSHRLFLFPLGNQRNDNIVCCACHKNIQSHPAYGCKSRKFYIHKSCFELPREIQHPFHRHPLKLPKPFTKEYHRCNACHKHYCSFNYHCQRCTFNLDLDCSPLFPSLKIESIHKHTLILLKMFDTPKCAYCEDSPRYDKLTPLDAVYFRCVVCNFSRHLLCCPLPQTIEHDSHHHSLTLSDNFVDIFDGFDDEEYCCDFCEIRRNAREPVYYCEECKFVVDIKCVFSKVMRFVEGNHKGVQGRIVSRDIIKNFRGFTYKCIVESLNKEEKKSMDPFIEGVKKIDKVTLLGKFSEFKNIDGNAKTRISKELLSKDEEFFNSMARKVSQLESIKEVLVDVQGYKICRKLAPVLQNLLNKYGDIGASCRLTQRVKTIPLTTLCLIMLEMSVTRMIDIKDDSIILWWFHLKLVEEAGFKTDFALNQVKRIFLFHFQKDDEIRIHSSSFYKIQTVIAERSKRIEEEREAIEILKKKAQDDVSAHGSKQLMSEAARLNESLEFLSKCATPGFLDEFPGF